jgi:hypothetical protein
MAAVMAFPRAVWCRMNRARTGRSGGHRLLSVHPATLNLSNIYSNKGVLWALLSVPA